MNNIPAGGLFTGAEVPKTAEQQAIWGGTTGAQFDPCYHQACDTFANNSNHALDVNSDAVAFSILTYAYSTQSVNGVPGKKVPGNFRIPAPPARRARSFRRATRDRRGRPDRPPPPPLRLRRVISVSIAGATGWTGKALVPAVREAPDLELVSAVSRSAAGTELDGVPVYGTVAEALEGVDVLVDYTSASAVKDNVMTALEAGVGVVVGSSGLTAEDYAEIEALARERGVGVVASGNFSVTAAMAQAAALLAARHLPRWEILDYASATKEDVPSGTARELAERLAEVREPEPAVPVEEIQGPKEARGAAVGGTQIHSVRLPSFVVSTEVVFAAPDERLTIRHDAGGSPEPYVAGTLLAVRKVPGLVGLVRGLDRLLLGE